MSLSSQNYILKSCLISFIIPSGYSRNRAGLQELQDRLAAEAENQAADFAGLTEEQMKIYSTIGGTPHLDGQYTVFGEVEEGLDVVEMIQATATGRGDRPVDDLEMRIVLCD